MNIILADWGGDVNGSRYTMHFTETLEQRDIWNTIDEVGNPSDAKYKVVTIRDMWHAFDHIDIKELEEGFEFLYEIAGEERDSESYVRVKLGEDSIHNFVVDNDDWDADEFAENNPEWINAWNNCENLRREGMQNAQIAAKLKLSEADVRGFLGDDPPEIIAKMRKHRAKQITGRESELFKMMHGASLITNKVKE